MSKKNEIIMEFASIEDDTDSTCSDIVSFRVRKSDAVLISNGLKKAIATVYLPEKEVKITESKLDKILEKSFEEMKANSKDFAYIPSEQYLIIKREMGL